jgi:predicted RNase H-like HicB family nuclease
MRYPVVIHKDPGSAYGITIPDLPGTFTAGDTVEEALANVQEAVECGYEGEDEIPAPRSIDDHVANPDYAGGVFAYAEVDLSRLKGAVVRVNITLPQRDLDLIDRAARALGTNRSSFLRDAAVALARELRSANRVQESAPPVYGAAAKKKSVRRELSAKKAAPKATPRKA